MAVEVNGKMEIVSVGDPAAIRPPNKLLTVTVPRGVRPGEAFTVDLKACLEDAVAEDKQIGYSRTAVQLRRRQLKALERRAKGLDVDPKELKEAMDRHDKEAVIDLLEKQADEDAEQEHGWRQRATCEYLWYLLKTLVVGDSRKQPLRYPLDIKKGAATLIVEVNSKMEVIGVEEDLGDIFVQGESRRKNNQLRIVNEDQECSRCEGTGAAWTEGERGATTECGRCEGIGSITVKRSMYRIKVPKDTRPGDTFTADLKFKSGKPQYFGIFVTFFYSFCVVCWILTKQMDW